MKATRIHFQWSPGFSIECFRSGVSLHSHTLHSREPLDFLYRAAGHSWPLRALLRQAEHRYAAFHGTPLHLSRGWWTPPLAPLDAYGVEFDQIEALNLTPFVSLTDHDDIEAPISLQAINAKRKVPISIEWTVPIRNTFFHLGVHNLSVLHARSIFDRMREFTHAPRMVVLKEILSTLHLDPGTLVVLNHPMWDEKGVGRDPHRAALFDLLAQCGDQIHALELNGLRPWHENRQTIQLAQAWSKPIVSGGDRHATEPNATLNLTNATHFAEFVAEVRSGHSDVLIGTRYRESHAVRIFRNVLDVLGTYEAHGLGWRDWPDRVFFTLEDGKVRSLSQIWGSRSPLPVRFFAGGLRLADRAPLQLVLRAAAGRSELVAER